VSHEHHYECRLNWTGASQGGTTNLKAYSRAHEISVAGKAVMKLSADPTFGGDSAIANPEDLLVAALVSCHFLSYAALCARKQIVLVLYEDDAIGKMEMSAGKIRFTDVLLRPRAVISSGDLELAKKLHANAHAECFIASSVNFPVRHEPVVVLRESAK
jgi:organic hydroperoxide reductase OsmC/OhrA